MVSAKERSTLSLLIVFITDLTMWLGIISNSIVLTPNEWKKEKAWQRFSELLLHRYHSQWWSRTTMHSDWFMHRPNRPWPRAPRNSFLRWLITNLKIAKLRRGTTSQFILKRSKIQTSKTRSLVTTAQWSLVVNDLSIILFLKYMSLSRQIYSVFDADLRLIFPTSYI